MAPNIYDKQQTFTIAHIVKLKKYQEVHVVSKL